MFNIKKCLIGCLLVSAVIPGAALLPGSKADAASISAPKSAVTPTGVIQASVRLRDKPSSSGQVIGYLKNGDKVTILESSTAYFYKVKTPSGKVGYTSSDERYITVPGEASRVRYPRPLPAADPALRRQRRRSPRMPARPLNG